jgi:hypothetical protein
MVCFLLKSFGIQSFNLLSRLGRTTNCAMLPHFIDWQYENINKTSCFEFLLGVIATWFTGLLTVVQKPPRYAFHLIECFDLGLNIK